MERNIGNVLFALFAVMLSMGSLFATSVNGSTAIIANSPPVITGVGGPTSLNAGEAGTWTVSAYDPNGNYLSYSVNWGDGLGQAQQGQTESSSTATFQHTYSSAGTYTITFTVTDSMGASTQSSVTTSVGGATVQADLSVEALSISTDSNGVTRFVPTIKNVGTETASGYTLIYYLDGAAVATQASNSQLAPGASESNELDRGQIAAGSHTMKVAITLPPGASNTNSENDYMTRTFEISGNQAPIITGVKAPVSLSVNQQGTWQVSAYDPDGTYLSYSVAWGDEGDGPVSTDAMLRTGSSASFQHAYSKAGTYKIVFTAKDSEGASTQSTSWMTVGSGSTSSLSMTAWAAPDSSSGLYMLYAKVSVNGQAPASGEVRVNAVVSAPNGETISNAMGPNGLNAGVYVMGFGASMPCGTYTYKITAERQASPSGPVSAAEASGSFALSTPYCTSVSSNLPPVITAVGGPAEISAGSSGTWSIKAYDPDGTYLSYSVNWGESNKEPTASDDLGRIGNSASFEHTYSKAGTYKIVFSVADSEGAKTQSSVTVKVTGSSSTSEVYAAVGAIPTEVYQYDSVYVTGKISKGSSASGDSAQTYRVVISLDNGNEMPKVATAEASISGSNVQVASSDQQRVEEITLYPGESHEVSAYFTASKLGTNFAKIMVYQKDSSRCREIDYANGNSGQAARCSNYYTLVASDSTKVYVKESGIPQPPNEGVTITLSKGWNQISVPAKELSVSELAAKCDISENVWYYNAASKQYEKATTLRGSHVGFWVKANAECKYTIDETYITPAPYAFNLKAGWNMIGAPLSTTSISNMAGDCKITSGLWDYSPAASQYTYSQKLEPGKGYWVKVASACTLKSASDTPPSAPTN